MPVKIVSTGSIIKMYLLENEISLERVAEEANLSLRTIMRVLNDECKLNVEIAIAINKLIPEIKPDFLLSYDSQYQLQKKLIEKENFGLNINKVIGNYQMKKLYKSLSNDDIALFEKAKEIFGLENIKNNYSVNLNNLHYCFSLAKGEKNHFIWLKAAYEDYKSSVSFKKRTFDKIAFKKNFDSLKSKTFTNDLNTTLYNMMSFCNKCGINFFRRSSIPGARVKAAAVLDDEGQVYIFVSDLFKCIENLWLAFIHECEHIMNDDFDKMVNYDEELSDTEIDENFIDEKAIQYFIGENYDINMLSSIDKIISLGEKTNSPVSIIAEIARFKNKCYSDQNLNKYIHYYKSDF